MDNFSQKPVGDTSLDAATRSRLAQAPTAAPVTANSPAVSDGFWHKNKWYVIVLACAVVVIALLGYFAFRKPAAPVEPKVTLEITAPSEVPSGNEGVAKVVVTNNESTSLANVEVELVYPNGVTFVNSNPNPQNLSGTLFQIPSIGPGQNAAILLKLKFSGGVNETRQVTASLRYKLAGISAEFTKQTQGTTKLVAAGVSLDIQGPQNVTNAQLVSYTIHYINQSQENFDRVRIKAVLPPGFQFAGSNPKPSQGNDTWDITSLTVGGSGQITISGTFQSASLGQGAVMAAQLLVPDTSGNYFTQAEASFTTQIAQTPLLVSQTWSGQTTGGTADPGQTLQYHVTYQNNAPVAAHGVRVVLTLDSSVVDLASIQAEGAAISNNTVTWTAGYSPVLEVLNPNESGSFDMTVRVKNPPVKDRSTNPTINTSLKIKSDEYDVYFPGNDMQIKLHTEAKFEGSASFSSGPKPPKVGQSTRYTVTLALRNTTNDVTGSTVTLFVPNSNGFDTSSISKAEADKVTFDTSTGKLVWKVDTVRAHTGEFSPVRTLQFQVSITPPSAYVGKPVVLAKDISFKGTDSFTDKSISLRVNDLTSQEAAAGGNGIVQP